MRSTVTVGSGPLVGQIWMIRVLLAIFLCLLKVVDEVAHMQQDDEDKLHARQWLKAARRQHEPDRDSIVTRRLTDTTEEGETRDTMYDVWFCPSSHGPLGTFCHPHTRTAGTASQGIYVFFAVPS